MLTILGSRRTYCDRVSRRDALRVGVLGGVLGGGGLTLADLLGARARAATTAPAAAPRRRSVIQVFLGGGPSHFETFDPKPAAPAEIRGPYAPIATRVPGTFVSSPLPKLAAIADRFTIIRSCAHENPGHGGGQRYIHTGYQSVSLEGELPHDYPAVGSITSRVKGAMHRGMPNFLVLGGNDGAPAYLGPAYAPFKVYSTGKPIGLELTPSIKLERLDDRRALRTSLDRLRRDIDAGRSMDSLDSLETQAFELLTSTKAHEAFDVSKESAASRARYGDHEAGKNLLLARRFVEAGAGFVTIRLGQWDHHGNAGGTITGGSDINAPQLDQSTSALITDLAERGLSDDVLVLIWGEFGRTPRINQFFGRDHWPQAMSVVVAGGGLKMGQVVGATDRKGERPADRMLSPGDVWATVYRQLGIDPSQSFVNGSGRPIAILGHGEPIRELVG
jgi:hypothetical protein